jgi:hypothetical protein
VGRRVMLQSAMASGGTAAAIDSASSSAG